MNVQIEESWKQHLAPEFEKDYFIKLTEFVRSEYQTTTIYPPGRFIFNAFNLCPFDKVKVVIIGQDPYHGPGQAHGLCFSVNDGVPFPPSLQNIFQRNTKRFGCSHPHFRQSDPLGESRSIITQCHTDSPCPSSRLSSTTGLGGIYRCRHPYTGRTT